MLAIVDYGVGNLTSIRNMLKKAGARDTKISADPEVLSAASKLILPGVGHFDYGMKQLKESNLVEVLEERVLREGVPILGICLGAQLLTRNSEEGSEAGLGWIDAETVSFDRQKLPPKLQVPHMGWADVQPTFQHPLFEGLEVDARFYFVHSYHMTVGSEESSLVKATHGYEFCAGIQKDHILGVQFHPEKSHRFGMSLLRNFVEKF